MNMSELSESVRAKMTKDATVTCSPSYLMINSGDSYGGGYFSVTGHHAHHTPDAPPEWIGANLRRALQTSEYLTVSKALWNDAEASAHHEKSHALRRAWQQEMIDVYRLKDIKGLYRKSDEVSVLWHYLTDDFITLSASYKYQGAHSYWLKNKDQGKDAEVSLYLSDAELGLVVRELLSRCEGPGCKQKKRDPFFFPVVP